MLVPRLARRAVGAIALLLPVTAIPSTDARAQGTPAAAVRRNPARPVASARQTTSPLDTTSLTARLYPDEIIAFVDRPTELLVAAHDALRRRDAKTAASDLAAAAASLRVQAGYDAGVAKADMLDAARAVDGLAAGVRSGNVRTTDQLDDTFGRAHRALARHHWERAARAWEQRDAQRTGMALRAAANATERAAQLVRRDADAGVNDVVRGARLVSGMLLSGAGWTVDEVGKGIADLGRGIERLGKEAEPRPR